MITKTIINANALDVRDEKEKVEVIKKPPCFFAYREKGHVFFRKLDKEGNVDMSIRAKKVPLAHFMANFHSFDKDNGLKVDENFKKDVFFFLGKGGLRKDSAIAMKTDFYLSEHETGDAIKFKKGDVLITTEVGINTAVTMDDFVSQYITEDKLHFFTKPEVTFIKSKENEREMSM